MAEEQNAVDDALPQFIAQETALFFEHLEQARKTFSESGSLPPSLFKITKIREFKKKGKTATARKPSVYNMFVREQYEKMRKTGEDKSTGELFQEVAAMWKQMPESEKQKYKDKLEKELAKAHANENME